MFDRASTRITYEASIEMKQLVALRQLAFEDLGLIEPVLLSRGWRVRYYDVGVDELWRIDLDTVDLLVVLGGPIGAEEDNLYPALVEELQVVARRIESGRAILGICLGAQLMARAMGARVTPMSQKEIGFSPLALGTNARGTPLEHIGSSPMLHWHGDQFELPQGAASLAATEHCPHQAFMSGEHVMALQFHLEVDPSRFEQWLIGHTVELRAAGVDIPSLRAKAAAYAEESTGVLEAVMTDWLGRLCLD